jgi:hypothetical protein
MHWHGRAAAGGFITLVLGAMVACATAGPGEGGDEQIGDDGAVTKVQNTSSSGGSSGGGSSTGSSSGIEPEDSGEPPPEDAPDETAPEDAPDETAPSSSSGSSSGGSSSGSGVTCMGMTCPACSANPLNQPQVACCSSLGGACACSTSASLCF